VVGDSEADLGVDGIDSPGAGWQYLWGNGGVHLEPPERGYT
jgi:hypothetical protein